MYNWHVVGNVTYTNGFFLTTQRIDISNIVSLFGTRTVNETLQAVSTIRGEVNFRDMQVGLDVVFVQEDGSVQHYTGVFTYVLSRFLFSISKNFHTGEFTTVVSSTSLNPKGPRMIYMPANSVTEVLSRRFTPSSISRSVREWATDTFQPLLLEIVQTKLEFPKVCFVNC
ncbi:uncharacterized protein [Epargyreus clarus]|uniref:uncharacterized protein n=1 Tax=Epargyreus clarus TaxID=520877 RepID=UPI003C2E7F02